MKQRHQQGNTYADTHIHTHMRTCTRKYTAIRATACQQHLMHRHIRDRSVTGFARKLTRPDEQAEMFRVIVPTRTSPSTMHTLLLAALAAVAAAAPATRAHPDGGGLVVSVDMRGGATSAFNTMYQESVGTGHASLWSRADWRSHLKTVIGELGFKHVRG